MYRQQLGEHAREVWEENNLMTNSYEAPLELGDQMPGGQDSSRRSKNKRIERENLNRRGLHAHVRRNDSIHKWASSSR